MPAALSSSHLCRHSARAGLHKCELDLDLHTVATSWLDRMTSLQHSNPSARLRAALDTDGMPPSQKIAQLQRLADLLDARGNQFFAPIAALLLWGTQLAFAVESWRAQCGAALGPWLKAAGEIEALSCLAGHAYENPSDPFPEIADGGPVFDGTGLGHPLLPRADCVRNDLVLEREPQAYVMSGSNMSGKRGHASKAALQTPPPPFPAHAPRVSCGCGYTLRLWNVMVPSRQTCL